MTYLVGPGPLPSIVRKVQREIVENRRRLRLPKSAHDLLSDSMVKLKEKVSSRSWGLVETKFVDEISHYQKRHISLNLTSARAELKKEISINDAEEFSLQFDTGIKFLEIAKNSDDIVKPIILYYSCSYICSAFTIAFFDWRRYVPSHGIKITHRKKNFSDIFLVIEKNGLFPKLATTCFITSGQPTPFSDIAVYSTSPVFRTEAGDLLENMGKHETRDPLNKISLPKLLNEGFGDEIDECRRHFGFHKFAWGERYTNFLRDVLILFAAGSMARYNLVGWKSILDGRETDYRLHFESAFDRYENFLIDAVAMTICDPNRFLTNALLPQGGSPYE